MTKRVDNSVMLTIAAKDVDKFTKWVNSIGADHAIIQFKTEDSYVARVTSSSPGILILAALYGKVLMFFHIDEINLR